VGIASREAIHTQPVPAEKVSSDQLALFAGEAAEVLPSVEDEDDDALDIFAGTV